MSFIVGIEGNDGSGKGKQVEMLQQRLVSAGRQVYAQSFPDLESETGQQINAMLHGEEPVDPYTLAALYAEDRLEHLPRIRAARAMGAVSIFDRFVASNLVFPPELVEGEAKKISMMHWISDLEFKLNGMPEPDLTIVLTVDPKVARINMLGRDTLGNTMRLDVMEQDLALQERVVTKYDELCQANPNTYKRIDCVDGRSGKMRDKNVIHAEIWSLVAPKLGIAVQDSWPESS